MTAAAGTDPVRYLLDVIAEAWTAGRLPVETLREHLVWLLQIQHRRGRPWPAEVAIPLLEAAGYVTDSPKTKIPEAFTVYQGRLPGHMPGVFWTPYFGLAYGFAQLHKGEWLPKSLPSVRGWVLQATIRRESVLLFNRLNCELIVRPHSWENVDVLSPGPFDAYRRICADHGLPWTAPGSAEVIASIPPGHWYSVRDEEREPLTRANVAPWLRLMVAAGAGTEEELFRRVSEGGPIDIDTATAEVVGALLCRQSDPAIDAAATL